MKYIGNGEGHTLLILTGAESLLIREVLDMADTLEDADGGNASSVKAFEAQSAFNRGIQRGTAKMAEEFKEGLKK